MGSGGKQPNDNALNAQVTQSIAAANTPSPWEQFNNKRMTDFFNWDTGAGQYAGQPKDVTQAPGMDNYLNIYGNADSLAQEQQRGIPGLALSNSAGTAYGNQINQIGANQRYDARAHGLSDGLSGIRAQMNGMENNQIGLDVNRAQNNVMNTMGNRSAIWNKPVKPGFWNSFKVSLGSSLGKTLGGGNASAAGGFGGAGGAGGFGF